MNSKLAKLVFVALICGRTSSAMADGPPRWDREQATQNGWIYDDFDAGVAKAKDTGKPMLVVLRCPP